MSFKVLYHLCYVVIFYDFLTTVFVVFATNKIKIFIQTGSKPYFNPDDLQDVYKLIARWQEASQAFFWKKKQNSFIINRWLNLTLSS